MLGSARAVLLVKKGEPLPATAMALYSFNEGTGSTSADLSGNNRTANISGATWATGHTGGGLQNVTTNIGARAIFNSPTDVLTVMGWVKPLDLAANSTHIAFGFIDNGENTGFALFPQRGDFGTPNIAQGNARIGATLYELDGPVLTVGVWTHMALTFDGSTVVFYVDGIAVDSASATGNIGTGDALCIAGGMIDGARTTNVVVDDIRVYNAALTPDQILTGMNTAV